MNKKTLLLLFFVITMLFSIIVPLFFINDIFFKIGISFKWYFLPLYIISIVLVFYLSLFVHELGHAFIFKINKVKINYIIVHIFVIDNIKRRFYVDFSLLSFLGGIVIPSFTSYNKDKLKKTLSRSLLAGPLFSIAYFILILISFLLTMFYSTSNIVISMFVLIFILTFLLSIIVILNSSISKQNIYGDFVACKQIKNNELFFFTTLLQYLSSCINNEEFLNILNEVLTLNNNNSILSKQLDMYIYHNLIFRGIKSIDYINKTKKLYNSVSNTGLLYVVGLYSYLYNYEYFERILNKLVNTKNEDLKEIYSILVSLNENKKHSFEINNSFIEKYILSDECFLKQDFEIILNTKYIEF